MNLAVSVSQKPSIPFMWRGSEKPVASLGNSLWSAANHLSLQTDAFSKAWLEQNNPGAERGVVCVESLKPHYGFFSS